MATDRVSATPGNTGKTPGVYLIVLENF